MGDQVEAMCRAFLQNAAARQRVVSRVAPEEPSADYLTGFGEGREAGELSALALILSVITGESATALIEEAQSQAAVDAAFPFELHISDINDLFEGDS
jgi:hypothetical protein